MKKKILLLGASGFIGKCMWNHLEHEYALYGTYHAQKSSMYSEDRMFQLDVQDTSNMQHILEITKPDTIISALRGDFEQQMELHRLAAEYIGTVPDGKLLFFSTANVFDNDPSKPHYEDDSLNSRTDYGKYKAKCEGMLRAMLGEKCIIIRIPAVWGKDCPRIKALQNGGAASTVTNFMTNIATDVQIARGVQTILQNDARGIFHIGTSDMCDYHEIQQRVCAARNIKLPDFMVEYCEETQYQVLFSHRTQDLPKLQMTIDEAIHSLL